MEIRERDWDVIKKLFHDAQKTSMYFSIATVKKDGTPHVSPFGSVTLTDKNKGYYFEGDSSIMAENLKHNKKVCIMAIDLRKWVWFKGFFTGKSPSPIGVRLIGKVSEKREPHPDEIALFKKLIRPYRFFKGYDLLWGDMEQRQVRDISFESFENINLRTMTYHFR